ncbi:MAG: hypothetical protein IRY87_05640 [Acetobacteraceae bacterium]|nr:hypothetical protein [Acetobacteraceae bacterium]
MLPKNRGNGPNTGNNLPPPPGGTDTAGRYAATIGEALRRGTGRGREAAKRLERWTGASNRTVRGWLAGTRGPSGEHLIILASHSDEVLGAMLRLIMHRGDGKTADLAVARRLMVAALAVLDAADSRPSQDGRR